MVTGLIGKKVGMTQLFAADGTVAPATVLKAGPCVVAQVKTAETDGYEAVQLGLVEAKPTKENKPSAGPLQEGRRAGDARAPRGEGQGRRRCRRRPGDQVNVSIFADGERVDVIGTSRGKGFQGVVKRHHFRGGRMSARLDVPPRARLDRRLVVPVARRQGHAHGRPHGRRPGDRAQPEGAARRRREQPAAARGLGARRPERHRRRSARRSPPRRSRSRRSSPTKKKGKK